MKAGAAGPVDDTFAVAHTDNEVDYTEKGDKNIYIKA